MAPRLPTKLPDRSRLRERPWGPELVSGAEVPARQAVPPGPSLGRGRRGQKTARVLGQGAWVSLSLSPHH